MTALSILLFYGFAIGFAKGNNIGISYAGKKWNPEYICVLNSDVKLIQDVYEDLKEINHQFDFAVLGPMVLSGDFRYDCNPMADHLYSRAEIEKEIRHSKRILKICSLHLWGLYTFYQKFKPAAETTRYKKKMNYLCNQTDCKLHGSCLFFSQKFFEHYKGFNEETFLYLEEDILMLELKKAGLHTFYSPKIKVYHAEDASTMTDTESDSEKIKFMYSIAIPQINKTRY